jgi:pyruvyltransferase
VLTKIKKKAAKLRNAYIFREKKGAIPCFWHLGSPNFGDDLNPELLAQLLGQPVWRNKKQNIPHILGVGSILERANQNSIVMGSGFINSKSKLAINPKHVFAVRGYLTKEKLGIQEDVLLGDPAVIIPNLLNISHMPTCEIAIVPHVDSYLLYLKQFGHLCKIIDPSRSVRNVVNDIASAKVILSQSLHGLVMADAMQIPNVWIAPHEKMLGGEFKFHDYYSTTNLPKLPTYLTDELIILENAREASVSAPKIPLVVYQTEYVNLLKKAKSLLKTYLKDQ